MSSTAIDRSIVQSFTQVTRAWNSYNGGPSGGFLLDTELAGSVWDKARAIDGPLNRCRIMFTSKSAYDCPAFDEMSRANGARLGGVRAFWQGTADDHSLAPFASQPAISNVTFVPKRLLVFTTPFSRDLLDDSEATAGMIEYAAAQEINFSVVDAMINGRGITHPLGVIRAPSTITVSRATPSTISQADIDNAWSRLWGFCRRNAIWTCSDDTLLKVDAAATALGWPAATYLPQGVGGNEFPLLKGRPLLPVEQCPALGTTGDLILGDWSQYGLVVRRAGVGNATPSQNLAFVPNAPQRRPDGTTISDAPEINATVFDFMGNVPLSTSAIESTGSEHFYFGTDSVAMRYKLRADGSPLWKQPVTIANGSQTAGPFCIIA